MTHFHNGVELKIGGGVKYLHRSGEKFGFIARIIDHYMPRHNQGSNPMVTVHVTYPTDYIAKVKDLDKLVPFDE